MRLLFVTVMPPLPANNGFKMRSLAMLEALRALGHEVSLLSFTPAEGIEVDRERLRELCSDVDLVPIATKRLSATSGILDRALALALGRSYAAQRFQSRDMKARVRKCLARTAVDAVLCDSVYAVNSLPDESPPVVVNSHNVEHVILSRYAKMERNWAKSCYARVESRRLRLWETSALRRAAAAWVCSHQDRAVVLRLCPDLPVYVAPNVVDLRKYHPGDEGAPSTVLYTGGMDWYPNRDAVEYFVERVLPHLLERVPGIRFVVAGRNPPDGFRRVLERIPQVTFTGTVTDMTSVIARASVCVVPLRVASGTRLKILEAAAMGKAIVSTSVGAEGLDFVDGEEILIADEPRRFAEAVARLLSEETLRRALGAAARGRAEREYGFEALRAPVREALAFVGAMCSGREAPVLQFVPMEGLPQEKVHP